MITVKYKWWYKFLYRPLSSALIPLNHYAIKNGIVIKARN